MALAVEVQLDAPLAASAARARELAATGVDGLFTFEGPHDVFFPLVLAAGATEVDLATNVAIALPRSPIHLAHAAYDLQQLSAGRFRLGLGSQIKPQIEKRYGSTWTRPVARMREWVLATKAILARWEGTGPLEFRGEFTTHTLMGPAFDPGPNPFGPPPVLVGALGPRMTAMAAEVADGVLVMPFNSARHLAASTLPSVQQGLDTGKRTRADIELVAEVIVAVGRTDEQVDRARDTVRWLLGFYASTPSYAPVLEAEGWGDIHGRCNALSKQGKWADMAGLISDDMVATIGVAGTPAECARAIVDRFGTFADRVCCYFPGYEPGDEVLAGLVAAIKAG